MSEPERASPGSARRPMKSPRMEGGKETHRTSTSYRLDTVGVLSCSRTTAHICLSKSHKRLNTHPTLTHTHTFAVSKADSSLQQPHMICQQGKKGVRLGEEGFGL